MTKGQKIETTANEIACFIANLLTETDRLAKRKVTVKRMELLRKSVIRDIHNGCLDSAINDYTETRAMQAELDLMNEEAVEKNGNG